MALKSPLPDTAASCLGMLPLFLPVLPIRTNLKAYLASAIVNRAWDCLWRDSRQVDCPVEDLQIAARQAATSAHWAAPE